LTRRPARLENVTLDVPDLSVGSKLETRSLLLVVEAVA
jgi:hypothetical protein